MKHAPLLAPWLFVAALTCTPPAAAAPTWTASAAPRAQVDGSEPSAAGLALSEIRELLRSLESAESEQEVARRERLQRTEAALLAAREARLAASAERDRAAAAPARIALLEQQLAGDPDLAPPAPAVEPSLERAERESAEALARTQELREQWDQLAAEAGGRDEALARIPEELSSARGALARSEESWLTATTAEVERRAELAAQLELDRARLELAEARRERLLATEELERLERARLERELARAETAADYWSGVRRELEERRAVDAARRVAAEAEQLRSRFPALAALQDGTAALIERGRSTSLDDERAALEQAERLRRELAARAETTRFKVAVGGLTEGIGRLLREEYEWLLGIESTVKSARRVRERNSRAQIELEQAKAELRSFTDRRAAARDLTERAKIQDAGEREAFERTALDVVEQRYRVLDDLSSSLRALTFLQLDTLRALEDLREAHDKYLDYVAGEILWVPSTVGGRGFDLLGLIDAAAWAADPRQWRAMAEGALGRLHSRPLESLSLTLLVLLAHGSRRGTRRRLERLGQLVRAYRTDRFRLTLNGLLLTLAAACPLPLTLWGLGELLAGPELESELGAALSTGLLRMAPVALVLSFLRALAFEGGVGEAHFRWPPRAAQIVRVHTAALETVVVPAGVVFQTFEAHGVAAWNDTIGRIAFIVAMGALVLFAWRVLHPERGALAEAFARNPDTLLYRTRRGWFAAAVGIPAAHLLLALFAYYYTAQQFEQRLEQSLLLTLLLVVLHGILVRWLFVTRRTLAVEQARKRAADRAADGGEERITEAGVRVEDEDTIDIPALDLQTRRLFRSGITIGALIGLYLIWAGALPALGGLKRIQVWPELALIESERFGALDELVAPPPPTAADEAQAPAPGEFPAVGRRPLPVATEATQAEGAASGGSPLSAVITLADLALALIVLTIAGVTARNVPALLEISLLQRLPLESGSRYAISTLVRYGILIIGASSAFGALGVGWEKVQWLAAALTFGLGFGLQEIFANFVSGVIILLERPVRIGDVVTVGQTEGTVTRLRMRATTILDWDRRELLVPNKEFITGSIINWSLSDPITRIHVDVGVAYGSDVELALELLRGIAAEESSVLADPPPRAWFLHFADSSLTLRLLCFIASRENYLPTQDALHRGIDARFREHGIEIAFPQRDLHLRSAPALTAYLDRTSPRGGADGGASTEPRT